MGRYPAELSFFPAGFEENDASERKPSQQGGEDPAPPSAGAVQSTRVVYHKNQKQSRGKEQVFEKYCGAWNNVLMSRKTRRSGRKGSLTDILAGL